MLLKLKLFTLSIWSLLTNNKTIIWLHDAKKETIQLDCPPLGVIDVYISEDLAPQKSVLKKQVIELIKNWEALWPILLKELLECRDGYEKEAVVSKDNLKKVIISPPGEYDG
jgi:hypothetical protein